MAFSDQVLLQDYIWWRYLRWTWKQCALTVCYVIFPFVSSIALLSSRKKWLNYLSHATSPYLHGKLINWRSAFYLSFGLLNIFISMNRVISIIYAFSYVVLHRMVSASIFTTRRYIIKFILTFSLPVWDSQSLFLTRYLGTLLGFQNYELLDFIL